ncbi:MAG: ferredoxin family protein [Desulforudis sp.]|nr:MAG: ferredoxin family protein [Desulforudis sp.]
MRPVAKRKKDPALARDRAALAPAQDKVSFYPAWCKRCGNCEAFCPRQAIGRDQWGYPFLAQPERCTQCGLCEMLCPDFALSVGEAAVLESKRRPQPAAQAGDQGALTSSPERLAPSPRSDEDG